MEETSTEAANLGDLRTFTPAQGSRLERKGFVTHGDLLRLAQRRRCYGIHTEPVISLSDPKRSFWVFKATVFKSSKCRGFVGYGDAHPGNVSPLIFNHAEMRMAETRAVNRALRKAYGIALCSLEELPPWGIDPKQIPVLRRSLQTQAPFLKGVRNASQDPRPQSGKRRNPSGRRPISRPRGSIRTRGARP